MPETDKQLQVSSEAVQTLSGEKRRLHKTISKYCKDFVVQNSFGLIASSILMAMLSYYSIYSQLFDVATSKITLNRFV